MGIGVMRSCCTCTGHERCVNGMKWIFAALFKLLLYIRGSLLNLGLAKYDLPGNVSSIHKFIIKEYRFPNAVEVGPPDHNSGDSKFSRLNFTKALRL